MKMNCEEKKKFILFLTIIFILAIPIAWILFRICKYFFG